MPVPIAAYASHHEGALELDGVVLKPDGTAQVRGRLSGSIAEPVALGARLAEHLTTQGAHALLKPETTTHSEA